MVVATLPLKDGGGEANVEVRGVLPGVLDVRENVRLVDGRFFTPGLYEVLVGRNARLSYGGMELGQHIHIGPGTWTVVGHFDAGGSAFDSEVWTDATVLNGSYQRPPTIYSSVTARLSWPDAVESLQDNLAHNPRIQAQATRETDYYAKQSRTVTTLITVLGGLVAAVMGLGAILAALNTMYAAIAERSKEIAVLRAIGFGAGAIVVSFVIESLFIAALGGLVGCIAVPADQRHHDRDDELADLRPLVVCFPDHGRPAAYGAGVRAGDGADRRPAAGHPRRAFPAVDVTSRVLSALLTVGPTFGGRQSSAVGPIFGGRQGGPIGHPRLTADLTIGPTGEPVTALQPSRPEMPPSPRTPASGHPSEVVPHRRTAAGPRGAWRACGTSARDRDWPPASPRVWPGSSR